MKNKGAVLFLGIIIFVSSWWVMRNDSPALPREGVVDVWSTWGDDSAELQSFFEDYSQPSEPSIKVTSRKRSDDLLKALEGTTPPDVVILSNADLMAFYDQQGLVEPLDAWISPSGIVLDDIFPASLAPCQSLDGSILCLPWGSDVEALFWNKDLFVAAGLDPERPPRTMEELAEYARVLTTRDDKGQLVQVGFVPDLPRSHTELFAGGFGGGLSSSEPIIAGQALVDALTWQADLYGIADPKDLEDFVSSFTRYTDSRHSVYAGRRLSCQQCHRAAPIRNGKTPDTGFAEGRVAMMVDGGWQVGLAAASREHWPANYGVAPFPPSETRPEEESTALVEGPVVFIPSGARDKEAAVQLLAWMMSPEPSVEAAHFLSLLPSSRAAAQDQYFRDNPEIRVFMKLLVNPIVQMAAMTPVRSDLNVMLDQIESEVLDSGGDTALLLGEAQAKLAVKLEEESISLGER